MTSSSIIYRSSLASSISFFFSSSSRCLSELSTISVMSTVLFCTLSKISRSSFCWPTCDSRLVVSFVSYCLRDSTFSLYIFSLLARSSRCICSILVLSLSRDSWSVPMILSFSLLSISSVSLCPFSTLDNSSLSFSFKSSISLAFASSNF